MARSGDAAVTPTPMAPQAHGAKLSSLGFSGSGQSFAEPVMSSSLGSRCLGLENVFGLSIASALVEAGGSALMSSFVGAFQAWA